VVQISPRTIDRLEEGVVAGDADQTQANHQHAGDRTALEGHIQCRRNATTRRFGRADIGPHRDIHADETGRAGQHGANQETECRQPAELGNQPDDEEENDADHGDGLVLPAQIRFRPLLDGFGDLLHTLVAGGQREDLSTGNPAIQDCQHGATERQ
jgi:hypothetical protein